MTTAEKEKGENHLCVATCVVRSFGLLQHPVDMFVYPAVPTYLPNFLLTEHTVLSNSKSTDLQETSSAVKLLPAHHVPRSSLHSEKNVQTKKHHHIPALQLLSASCVVLQYFRASDQINKGFQFISEPTALVLLGSEVVVESMTAILIDDPPTPSH